MRSILAKIIFLLLLFNCALWLFFIVSDDYVDREAKNRVSNLVRNTLLFGKVVQPVLNDETISEFQKSVRIQTLLSDKRLIENRKLRIYRLENFENLDENFVYFDGSSRMKYAPIKQEALGKKDFENVKEIDPKLQFASQLFQYYKPIVDKRLITEPIRTKAARFSIQKEILPISGDAYSIRVLTPIRIGVKTVGVVETWDTFYIREAYVDRNGIRLTILIGVSILTLLFGAILAISIAFPLRRLSRKLDQKLTPEDIATQLENFGVVSLATRKDEIGRLHKNLVTLTNQVSALFKEKEQFAADVSHELKNPIASIMAYTENLQDGSTKLSNDAITKIQNQAIRMNTLVSEISEAAIIDHDLVTKKRERFDLTQLVSEIVSHYKETNEYTKLEITYKGPNKIMMNGLPDRIGQVIVNLVENAISFTRPIGTININVSKKWRKSITIKVEDSGPGVRDELKDKIFDRFFTSRRGSAEEENSSGLGLYICKQIVEAHRGQIGVTDRTGGGAAFIITI